MIYIILRNLEYAHNTCTSNHSTPKDAIFEHKDRTYTWSVLQDSDKRRQHPCISTNVHHKFSHVVKQRQ
ncbi:hypothetical protein BLNAU_22275 [Blattamonas nauphoetae]|uniref:Uncharacterized protein n=1 Tax=Blattamonas nauphoetae TaxID=2049346 RepID=A0ABQ9WTI7_9EUKA|nr:hypothetical protein BLNAU_22275 [Blattamonas nauphoetae]